MSMTVLKKAVAERDLTITKLGLALRVNSSLISQVASGKRYAYPKLRRQIAEVLQMPEEEIFTSDGWLREEVK